MKKSDYNEETYYKNIEQDLRPLIQMNLNFEDLIADYEITKTEDLWDEEFDQVVRAFFFENGTRQYIISITPDGLIRMPHTKYPAQLSVQIHNVIAGMYADGRIGDTVEALAEAPLWQTNSPTKLS